MLLKLVRVKSEKRAGDMVEKRSVYDGDLRQKIRSKATGVKD